jgi:16S rRNA (cytidine1402-2'-O)-methyltransferase
MGVQVVPASGPSSIILALTASGFNGQEFSFHGYLPIDRKARTQKIRQLENDLKRSGQTQIFMETPYRNEKLVDQLIDNCQPTTQLCVATDLTLNSERISTRSLEEWKKHLPKIHKRYCIFLIGKRK